MIPFTTSTAKIEREVIPLSDSLVDQTYVVVARGIPAVFHSMSGDDTSNGGQQEIATAKVDLPVGTDVQYIDRITDETTGDVWEATWVRTRMGFGLDHMEIGLHSVKGANLIG